MTIKDLEKKYVVLKQNKDVYSLHDREEHGFTQPYKFLCVVYKKGIKFHLENEEPTHKIDVLEEQINSYLKSLPYDSQFYNPFLNAGYNEKNFIHYYMDSLNFTYKHDNLFVYEPKNIYNDNTFKLAISFNDIVKSSYDGELPETINVSYILNRNGWIELNTPRDLNSIKNAIDSIIYPVFLSESVELIKAAEKCSNGNLNGEYLYKNLSGLNINVTNYNKVLKEKLLELANKL